MFQIRSKDNDDYVNGGGFCCDDNPSLRAGAIGAGNDNPETFQYYYHSDHLGSASLITNLDGEVVQHVEYIPFGEVFIEERNNKWNTPYLFNAKELDEETGLYYYGARYYDSKASLWLGVDPMWEKYQGISVFAYCANNPIRYIDPTGMDWYQDEGGNTIWYEGSENKEGYTNIGANYTYREGNLTLTYEQNELEILEEHILEPNDWSTSQTTNSDGTKKQCFTAAKEMVATTGATVRGGGQAAGIVTGKESVSENSYSIVSNGNTTTAINYIDSQIDLGYSVAIGVDYKKGSPNNDGVTDHWVSVSSRITNIRSGSTSYRFYDPGTSNRANGTHINNIFSLNDNGMLSGSTHYKVAMNSKNPDYTVTQIRRNQ
jgi:RHS repeat-associated protein